MKFIYRFTASLIMLLAIACNMQAQQFYDEETKARNWYADVCENAINSFEEIHQHAYCHPQKYCIFPYQQATPLGYALVMATFDEQEFVLFVPEGKNLKAQHTTKDILPNDIYWENISELGVFRTKSKDVTLKERPLPVRTPNKAKNIFGVVVEGEERIPDIKAYNQMIFKPHQNIVRLSNQHENKKTDADGTIIKDEVNYEFRLANPSVTAKMFRGYEDDEMCPWVVKSSFFNNHALLQYSRWKYGEPVKKASKDVCRIISDYYGGRPIKETRWLATIESGERSFYAVQFELKGKEALAAMVCIGEGNVTSAWEFHGEVDPSISDSSQSIWFVDDEGDFMEHAPEIHCIVATDEGLELYIRLFGGESVQYFVLREMGPVWMTLQRDYWVYVWD